MLTSTSALASMPSPLNATGIEADAQLVRVEPGVSSLEVAVTTHVRQVRGCDAAGQCPGEYVYLVKSSVLLDYRFGAQADPAKLTVINAVGASSSVKRVLTIQNVDPGVHCLVVFSQILRIEDDAVTGGEALVGTFELASLGSKTTGSTSVDRCSTKELTPADGTFVPFDNGGCGGLPNGITTDLDGNDLSVEELLVLVPTCPQSLVAVILNDGEMVPEQTRLVAGQPRDGFFGFVLPRLRGRWRVAILPDERFREALPADSPYWDVVISPPREF